MRNPIRAAWAVGVLLASTVTSSPSSGSFDRSFILETRHPSEVRFNVSHLGLFRDGVEPILDQAITFDLQIAPSAPGCVGTVAFLDGLAIEQPSNAENGEDQDKLSLVVESGNDQWEVILDWTTSCILPTKDGNETAEERSTEILTAYIVRIGGKDVVGRHGFTASYNRGPDPELLRLLPDVVFPDVDSLKTWTDPAPEVRVHVTPSVAPPMEDFAKDVERMKQDVHDYSQFVWHLGQLVSAQRYNEAPTLHEQLKHCDGIKCVAEKVAQHAHGAFATFCSRMKEKHFHHTPAQHQKWSMYWQQMVQGQGGDEHHHGHRLPEILTTTATIPQEIQDLYEAHPHRESPRPHPAFPQHNRGKALKIFGLVAVGSILIYLLTHRHYCDPSAHADRRWIRESRRQARQMRRAEQRQALRQWWSKVWHGKQKPLADEEKRTLVRDQESILEDAMRAEIQDLRQAADFVQAITSPQGSSPSRSPPPSHPLPLPLSHPHSHPQPHFLPYAHPYRPQPFTPRRPLAPSSLEGSEGYSYSLDDEPPPTYISDDGERSDVDVDSRSDIAPPVADGFQYRFNQYTVLHASSSNSTSTSASSSPTSHHKLSDSSSSPSRTRDIPDDPPRTPTDSISTPDSSVIETSPRCSSEFSRKKD
ncbi:MAG: hypothetical protein M1838_006008 [Thelocarpon superellum]|nr:MAG: hypothetical protein M1838_006008 [Thelocarpon superellum]